MSQFIGKPLMVALFLAQGAAPQGPVAAPQEPSSSSQEQTIPQDPVCYDYYLKMHDIEAGTLEYLTQRNKMLEFKCGAFGRVAPKK